MTPNYKDNNYLEAKETYYDNEKEFHKYGVKLKTKLFSQFLILLIGFDGEIKKKYRKINLDKIISDIKMMPLGHIANLSLYANYNKNNYTQNLGYKDEEKALYTIDKIKNRSHKYQVSVITTMLNRALNHPNRTSDMDKAIRVFQKWIKNNKTK